MYEEADYGGIDDEIVVKGRQSGGDIEFVKYYLLEHIRDGDDNLVSFESDNPTIVYYMGSFLFGENKFKGQWELPALIEDDDGVFHEESRCGFWEMWRGRVYESKVVNH